jgi:hypothetical protein
MSSWESSADPRSLASPTPVPPVSPTVRSQTTCELRVLHTVAELIESYRLRYEVYGKLGYLQRINQSRMDIDEYDSSSIPFGAFDAETGAMIGTLRVVTTEPQPDYDYLVRYIVASCRDTELAAQAWAPQPHPLPSIISDENDRQIEVFNTERFAVHELSRFIVHPGHRSSNVSRALVMLSMAHATRSAPAVFIASCLPTHVRLYARYGFSKVPNTGLDHFASVGQVANTIICRSDMLPPALRSDMDGLSCSMAAGASEHTHELGRDSRAIFRLAAPRRVRRRTREW